MNPADTFSIFSWLFALAVVTFFIKLRNNHDLTMFIFCLSTAFLIFRIFGAVDISARTGAWIFILLVVELCYLMYDLHKSEKD